MRRSVLYALASLLGFAAAGCRSQPAGRASSEAPPPASGASAAPASVSSAAIAGARRELQANRLRLPSSRRHRPVLAFGKGVLGRLREHDVQVLDDRTLTELATIPLVEPRAVLGMADGALVAVGASGLVRWERDQRPSPPTARLVLFPGSEIFPDAREPDVVWVLEPDTSPPQLGRYRVGATALSGLLAPEQIIELTSARGGTFGVTREGVWLYATPGQVERLGPSGTKLPGLRLADDTPVPTWMLASRRLDQSAWLDDEGALTRALVSPTFKALSRSESRGVPYSAAVGDEGRLLAVSVVTGAGPRFELVLFDAELRERGRAMLPAESPTGGPDWIQEVTRNQQLAVAPRDGRVAVGGPDRLTLFGDRAQLILSIPIR